MKKIFLTEYDTIRGEEFDEITTKKFLRMLIKGDKIGFYYSDNANRFIVCSNYNSTLKYELVLEEVVMENFKNGIYTPFTYELKKILDEKAKQKKQTEIINYAEKHLKIGQKLDKESLVIYLESLKNDLKFSLSDIIEYLDNQKVDLARSIEEYNDDKITNWFIKHIELMSVNSNGWYLMIIPLSLVSLLAWLITFPVHYIKNRGKRFGSFIKNRHLTKRKIKSLTLEKTQYLPPINDVEKVDVVNCEENLINVDEVKEIETESLKVSRIVLNELSLVIDGARSIVNETERLQIVNEVHKLLNEFNERMSKLENHENDDSFLVGGRLTHQGYDQLKNEMILRIADLKYELDKLIQSESSMNKRVQMSLELQKNLDEMREINPELEQRVEKIYGINSNNTKKLVKELK